MFIKKLLFNSVGEKHRTHRTFPMARPKCLMGDFTNLYGIYTAHQTNVWWTTQVFRLHCFNAVRKELILCICVFIIFINANTLDTYYKKFWTILSGGITFICICFTRKGTTFINEMISTLCTQRVSWYFYYIFNGNALDTYYEKF